MRALAVVVLATAAMLSGCSDDEEAEAQSAPAPTPASASASASGSGSASASTATSPPSGEFAAIGSYPPVSDVVPHLAVGKDAAKARELMAPATEGGEVDWAAVGVAFREGGESRKGDGTIRTLATLLAEHPSIAAVNAAIDGTGDSADAEDAVRRQQVDKGITVILAAKVIEELGRAKDKIEADELDPTSGAAHNVDEAAAFFQAEGQGPASTAEKRGADFSVELLEPVYTALTAAQKASLDGDLAAFDTATEETQQALDHIFYLATFKYLDTGDDAIKRAEGESFYLAIQERVKSASSAADSAITGAFADGDAAAGREALNGAEVREALGVEDAEVPAN